MALDVFEAMQRLVKAATGEPWGDGMMVTNIGQGVSEPGYGDDNTIWAFGDWNPKRFRKSGEPPLTNEESLPERLGKALERIGVECHWLDEWATCMECNHAIRVSGDSYFWQPYYLNDDDNCDRMCLDCFHRLYSTDDTGLWDFHYVNDPTKCLPDSVANDAKLEEGGCPKPNGVFENGWHPGQTDDPKKIYEQLEKEHDVIFRLDETSQFYLRFTAWIKPKKEDDDDDE